MTTTRDGEAPSLEAEGQRFENLRYADFQRMAQDDSLTPNEMIGFPESYRKGFESAIYADISAKLPNLSQSNRHVLDIGPGCADLPRRLMRDCAERGHHLVLVDSAEMLAKLPDGPAVTKIAGFYPECRRVLEPHVARFDGSTGRRSLRHPPEVAASGQSARGKVEW